MFRTLKTAIVLIADDHEVLRRGIRALLEARPEWKICGEASTGREAVEKTRKLRPDLLLLDLTMPEMDGLEAIPRVLDECPGTKIVVLTMNDSRKIASRSLAAGANSECRNQMPPPITSKDKFNPSGKINLPVARSHQTNHRAVGKNEHPRSISRRCHCARTGGADVTGAGAE